MFGWVRESKTSDGMARLIRQLTEANARVKQRDGEIESYQNALHARGRTMDYLARERDTLARERDTRDRSITHLVGEVDAAQEDARAAKALASFWMQSWLAGLGEAPKEITA